MRGRQPRGAEILAAVVSGESPERDGRVRRAISGGADLRDRPVHKLGEDRETGHAADPALIGRHAERGVALEMLDRAEAFPLRKRDVAGRNVVLEIDERLAASLDV